MADFNVVTLDNLGTGFDVDTVASKINVTGGTITVTTEPLYEYRYIWAEESGGVGGGSEWSYGNGATGFMGLPQSNGWEIVEMGFHADTYPATATITVDLVNFITPSTAAPVLASISLSNSTDGGGTTNNAKKVVLFVNPPAVPNGAILGFDTDSVTGAISDARVSVGLRRQVGSYVSGVTLA